MNKKKVSIQHQVLSDFGVDYAQGYLYARPMPAHQLEPFLEQFDPLDVT